MWKRDTTQPLASYVDLFSSIPDNIVLREQLELARLVTRVKFNESSEWYNELGDKCLDDNNYVDALNNYRTSLRYAEVGTVNVALAYAKRSACFYRAEMYVEALADIELAIDTGVSNDDLLAELRERKQLSLCYLATTDGAQQELENKPTLDYAAHEYVPCLAIVVDMKYDPKFGRHLVANKDISQGKVILLEENFAVNKLDETCVCYTCFSESKNLIPCEQCTCVMFCSHGCMNRNQTHALECGTFFGTLHTIGDPNNQRHWLKMKFIMQTVFIAISTFPSVEKLMEFVEKTLEENPEILPESLHDVISKYHFFFKLKGFEEENNLIRANYVYKVMMELPKIRALFDTYEKQRFLQHLIAHHTHANVNFKESRSGNAVSNLSSLLNHSCEPNAVTYITQNMITVKTTRLVRNGEQLFLNYVEEKTTGELKNYRKRKIQSDWGFSCKCSKCESE